MSDYEILMNVPAIYENGQRIKFNDSEERQDYIDEMLSSGKYAVKYKKDEQGRVVKANFKSADAVPEKKSDSTPKKDGKSKSFADLIKWIRTAPLKYRIPIAVGSGLLCLGILLGLVRLVLGGLHTATNAVQTVNQNRTDWQAVDNNVKNMRNYIQDQNMNMQDQNNDIQDQNMNMQNQNSDRLSMTLVNLGYTQLSYSDLISAINGDNRNVNLRNGIFGMITDKNDMRNMVSLSNADPSVVEYFQSLIAGERLIGNNAVMTFAYKFNSSSDAEDYIANVITVFGSNDIGQAVGAQSTRCNYGIFNNKTSVVCDMLLSGSNMIYCFYQDGDVVYFFMAAGADDNFGCVSHISEICNSMGFMPPYDILNGVEWN